MKKYILFVVLIIAVLLTGYIVYANNSHKEITNMEGKKVLIAYYSYSGNTKAAAQKIQNITGGDLFEIKPKKEYSKDYNTVVDQAQQEKQNDVRPELVENIDVSGYDVIFIGTPVWWYTMTPPVKTFITSNNFEGKIIAPFCTHGGGGESSTYTDIKKLAPGADVKEGYTSYENSALVSDIKKWISKI